MSESAVKMSAEVVCLVCSDLLSSIFLEQAILCMIWRSFLFGWLSVNQLISPDVGFCAAGFTVYIIAYIK